MLQGLNQLHNSYQIAGKSMAFQSGHSTNTNVLSEDEITKLFVAVAYKQNLMEAPGMLSNLKKQIGKGVTKLGQKSKTSWYQYYNQSYC